MNREDLEKGPVVRVKVWKDFTAAVIRYSLFYEKVLKEYLSPSGEWVVMKEGELPGKVPEVFREGNELW
jgi:hypothetical protein